MKLRHPMRATQIKYMVGGETFVMAEVESEYKNGDISYEQGVINRLESITDGGGIILTIEQYTV